jgi:DNA-directed RNA polymerase specialized sigma subunit
MGEKSKYYMLYKFNDGTSYKVEVGKDGVTEADMRCLRRMNKGRVKKEPEAVSLDAIISGEDKHSVLVDEGVDVALIVETADEYASLHKAIKKLLPQQQELINQLFIQNEQDTVLANELGISKQAINRRLLKIYAQLKKYF